jgi:hypothetical protein
MNSNILMQEKKTRHNYLDSPIIILSFWYFVDHFLTPPLRKIPLSPPEEKGDFLDISNLENFPINADRVSTSVEKTGRKAHAK